jgi:hypothetical protein
MAKRPGPDTILTPEIQEKIVQCILRGAYVETAVTYAGVSKQAFYNWLKRGNREKEGIYRRFVDAIEKAMSESELTDILIVDKSAKGGQWQAAAWRLERRFPQRWGRRTEVSLDEETTNTLASWLAQTLKPEK